MRKFLRKQKLLFIFFFALTALTIISYVDTEAEKKEARTPKEIMSQSQTRMVQSTEHLGRKVASLQNTARDEQTIKTKFFCGNQEERINVKRQMIILEFNSCLNLKSGGLAKGSSYSIQNLTNGFKGQVFQTNKKTFKTDFIQLSSGINKIELQYYSKDKQYYKQSLEIISGS